MTVCNFFLQGRCRYGEKCWNEHPRGGGGGYGSYSRPSAQSSGNRGGGGFANKVWVNPSQRSSGRDYVQSSSFSKSGGREWGAGGGEDRSSSSSFSFSTQNRYSSLSPQQASGPGPGDDNDKYVETVSRDMEAWESSGQWPFSCYSAASASISGFTELAPEELRLEYYTSRASGGLQNYANAVQQLASQWRSRVQELKNPNSTTRAALIAELKNPSASLGFPSAGSIFGAGFGAGGSQSAVSTGFGAGGSQSAVSTGFVAGGSQSAVSTGFGAGGSQSVVSTGFGSAAAQAGPAGFGSAPTAASFSFSSVSASTASSFGAGSAPSAASFSFSSPASSFAAPVGNKDAPAGFGATAADFSFSASTFGVSPASPAAAGSASFGQLASGAGPVVGGCPDQLFTPQGELSSEELKEFRERRFTLGQVPLRPPPADLLVV